MHIPHCNPNGKKYGVFGWNEYVRAAHQLARSAFLAWRAAGSPVDGSIADHMNITRKTFKYAFRSCKRLSNHMRGTSMSTFLKNGDCRQFWRQIQKDLKPVAPVPLLFDNVLGEINIANHWKQHFAAIYQDASCSSSMDGVHNTIDVEEQVDEISTQELDGIIRGLKGGKAPGLDNISMEHIIFLNRQNREYIRLFLNVIMFHAYLPRPMNESLLVPIVKDKAGDIGSLSNYRAIALSTSISKLYELIILDRLKPELFSDDAQFGFKCDHSTTQAALLLKEICKHYTDKGSPVYACFLDATKAFDRVCHDKLFTFLRDRGIPSQYVKILVNWYSSQQMCVRWGSSLSEAFSVKNGVKQGGCLSPLLFNVYLNDLLIQIRKLRTGCHLAGLPANVIAYADDVVLLSPTRQGLQTLVDTAQNFAQNMDIRFNVKKSVAMCIAGRNSKLAKWLGRAPSSVLLYGTSLIWVEEFKYLGHVITHDLNDYKDTLRIKRSLYFQTNLLTSKFHFMNRKVLTHLFKTYCSQLYGVELWDLVKCKSAVKNVCKAYHACIKRLLGIPKYSRNHTLCDTYGLLTCEALLAKRSFFLNLSMSKSTNILLLALRLSSISHSGILASNNLVSRRLFHLLDCDLDGCTRSDVIRALKRHISDVAEMQRNLQPD